MSAPFFYLRMVTNFVESSIPAAAVEGIPVSGYPLPCASPGPLWGGGREGVGVIEGIKKERHPAASVVRAPKCQRLGVSLASFIIEQMFGFVNTKMATHAARTPC